MERNRSNIPSISPAAVVVAAVFLLVSVIGVNWFTTFVPRVLPPQASAESRSVDELFYILMIIGGVVFFLIQGMLLISVIFFRARDDDRGDGPTYHGNPLLELVWTIIPALVVVYLAVISFNVWNQNSEPKAAVNMINGEETVIRVTGARYAWTHNYETSRLNPEGEPIVINSGDKLHTYIGQNVDLELRTQDVIHSYWVPAMRVKQDLLPGDPATGGRPTEIRFTPVRVDGVVYPAEYPIVCAELCGDGHGRMRGTVVVYEDEAQFLQEFYEPAIHAILNPPADPVLRGEIVIQQYICNSCHTLDSLGWSSRTGPSMNGIADRAGERVAGQSAEEYIATSVWNASAFVVPGYTEQMAAFGPDQTDANKMSAEQLYAIVAYLCTQGEQSDCDNENSTVAIPEAIRTAFGLEVDITFGQGDSEAPQQAPVELPTDPILRGEAIITGFGCDGCHTLDSLGWSQTKGADLNGIADRAGERVEGQSAEEYLVTTLWQPSAFLVPGFEDAEEPMAQFGPEETGYDYMNQDQLYAIIAYLCTQGEQSDCDLENMSTVIPETIKDIYGLDVDTTFSTVHIPPEEPASESEETTAQDEEPAVTESEA